MREEAPENQGGFFFSRKIKSRQAFASILTMQNKNPFWDNPYLNLSFFRFNDLFEPTEDGPDEPKSQDDTMRENGFQVTREP